MLRGHYGVWNLSSHSLLTIKRRVWDLHEIIELIEIAKEYMLIGLLPDSKFDIFVRYWIPIIQALTIITGAIAGLIKPRLFI